MNIKDFISLNTMQFDTVYIVGKGRSLEFATLETFGHNPIICINESIAHVEKLHPRNIIFSMQKDGAVHHNGKEFVGVNECLCVKNNLTTCPYGMVTPERPATILLVCENCSIECYDEYPNRITFNNDDYGLTWDEPSVLSAIHIAKQLGAKKINMVAFDSYVNGSTETFIPTTGNIHDTEDYKSQHVRMKNLLSDVLHEFVTPEKSDQQTLFEDIKPQLEENVE